MFIIKGWECNHIQTVSKQCGCGYVILQIGLYKFQDEKKRTRTGRNFSKNTHKCAHVQKTFSTSGCAPI